VKILCNRLHPVFKKTMGQAKGKDKQPLCIKEAK
jgi:hypothetical protein